MFQEFNFKIFFYEVALTIFPGNDFEAIVNFKSLQQATCDIKYSNIL